MSLATRTIRADLASSRVEGGPPHLIALAVVSSVALLAALVAAVRVAESNPRGQFVPDWTHLLPPVPGPAPIDPGGVTTVPAPAPNPILPGSVIPPDPSYRPPEVGFAAPPSFRPGSVEEQEVLDLNPWLSRYLSVDHSFPTAPRAMVSQTFSWTDDRNRLVWSGCEAQYDPALPPLEFGIEVPLDTGEFERIERHYGLPDDFLGTTFFMPTAEGRAALDAVTAGIEPIAGSHGWELRPPPPMPDYDWLVHSAAPRLRPVADEILRRWRPMAGGPDHPEWLEAVTSFVQRAIPYRRIGSLDDGLFRFELRTPGITLLLGGDCDSKSILLAALIRSLDPDVPLGLVVIRGVPEWHAMLGVGIPDPGCGTSIEASGQRYVLIESTDGWGIGRVHPSFNPADVDSVVPIR